MTTKIKIYIALAVAAAISIGVLGRAAWSGHEVQRLEGLVETERQRSARIENDAAEKEQDAARYREKTEYLEQQIAEITAIKRKQDEQLEKLNINTRNARTRVVRARSLPPATVGSGDLCKKLADAGHPCGPE